MVPKGLFLNCEVISVETEAEIVAWLDSRTWSNDISRRTQQFGYDYNYRSKTVNPITPMTGPILELAEKIKSWGVMQPVQCIVNEYYRAQGIAPHIDSQMFGNKVISISLNANGVIIFQRTLDRFECFLPRRSLVLLQDEARYHWTHTIEKKVNYTDPQGNIVNKPQDYRRISLTYRELA